MQSNGNVSVTPGVRWDGIDKIEEVHPTMVADYVKRGWVILMAYSARDDVTESSWARGYQETSVRCEYRPVVLMGQTNLDAIREKNEQLLATNKVLLESDRQHQELKKKFEEVSKRAAEHDRRASAAEEHSTYWNKKSDEHEALRRKLETDISKIRMAIGEIRMKEILGG